MSPLHRATNSLLLSIIAPSIVIETNLRIGKFVRATFVNERYPDLSVADKLPKIFCIKNRYCAV